MNNTSKLLETLFLPALPENNNFDYCPSVSTRAYRVVYDKEPEAPSRNTKSWCHYGSYTHTTVALLAYETPEESSKEEIRYFQRIEIDDRAVFFKDSEGLAKSIQNAGNVSTIGYRVTGNDTKMVALMENFRNYRSGFVFQLFGTLKELEEFENRLPSNILPTIRQRNYDSEMIAWHTAKENIKECEKNLKESNTNLQEKTWQKKVDSYTDQIARYSQQAALEAKDPENQEWIFEYVTLAKQNGGRYEYENPLVTLASKTDGGTGMAMFRSIVSRTNLKNIRESEEISELMRRFRQTLMRGMVNQEFSFMPPWINTTTTKKPEGSGKMPMFYHQPVPSELLFYKTWESFSSEEAPANGQVMIHTTLRGKPTDQLSKMQLQIDETFQGVFNSVKNCINGLVSGMLSRVTLARQGTDWVKETLQHLGYDLSLTENIQKRIENETIRNLKVRTPNYPLTSYEGIAYFRNTTYIAQEDLHDPETNKPIWIAGKSYKILPSWERREIAVNQELAENPDADFEENASSAESAFAPETVVRGSNPDSKRDTLSGADESGGINRRTYVTHGFSVFHIETEEDLVSVSEMDTEAGMGSRIAQLITEIETNKGLIEDIKKHTKLTSKQVAMIKDLEEKNTAHESDLLVNPISLEDFMRVFPPEPPPLATEIYNTELSAKSQQIQKRFRPLYKMIPEQILAASLASVKTNAILNCPPGGGKTLQAIMSAYASGTHYWWVICPTKVMDTWVKEIEKTGFHYEVIGAEKKKNQWVESGRGYEQLRQIDKRTHQRVRIPGRDGKLGPEFFIISAEVVAYGFGTNFQTHPWETSYKITSPLKQVEIEAALEDLPPELENVVDFDGKILNIWSNRMDNQHIIHAANLKGLVFTKGIEKQEGYCPKCSEERSLDKKGVCRCGHMHAFQGVTQDRTYQDWKNIAKTQGFTRKWINSVPRNVVELEKKYVLRQHPGYKLMTKHVKGKIIDEIHELASITSQRGKALQQVKSKRTILTTGTLCRTKVSELEAILSLSHQADSEAFPYRHWDLKDFREDYTSHMIIRETGNGKLATTRKEIPEPSNITRLRGLLHGILCPISENSVERSWGLKPIIEKIRYVELGAEETQQTVDWNNLLMTLGETLSQNRNDQDARRQARQALGALRYAHESPQKIEEAVKWARETIQAGKRGVIVGPSRNMHNTLAEAFRELAIPFTEIDGSEGTRKRATLLNEFKKSDCPIILTRIKLVNTNYNQLICCQRGLFLALDPSPAAIRQMQKRLNRIGQTEEVEWTFLVSRLPIIQRFRSLHGKNVLKIDEKAKYAIVAQNQETQVRTQEMIHNEDQIVQAIQEFGRNETSGILANAETTSEPRGTATQRVPLEQYVISPEEAFLHLVLRREQSIQETTKRVTTPRSTGEIIEETRKREDFEETIKSILEAGQIMAEDEDENTLNGNGNLESLIAIITDDNAEEIEEPQNSVIEVPVTTIEIETTQTSKKGKPKKTETRAKKDKKADTAHEKWEKRMAAQIGSWKTPEEIKEINRGKRGKNKVNEDQGFLFDFD